MVDSNPLLSWCCQPDCIFIGRCRSLPPKHPRRVHVLHRHAMRCHCVRLFEFVMMMTICSWAKRLIFLLTRVLSWRKPLLAQAGAASLGASVLAAAAHYLQSIQSAFIWPYYAMPRDHVCLVESSC
jgi:hypothetical protein